VSYFVFTLLITKDESIDRTEESNASIYCYVLFPCFRLDVQKALNQELHKSSAQRADGSTVEDFKFTSSGMGNIPVEILNLRRNFRGWSRTLEDVYFEVVSLL
jgi:hypothetical protein